MWPGPRAGKDLCWGLGAIVLAGVLACGGKLELERPSAFLEWCGANAECSEGACVCGICTVECETGNSLCSGGPAESVCFSEGTEAHQLMCSGRPVSGLCLPACSETQPCPGGLNCRSGACLPADIPAGIPAPVPEAVSVDAGAQPIAELPDATPKNVLCATDNAVSGVVLVWKQEQLESLRGCEIVEGDLLIDAFVGLDLTPLESLRIVRGELRIETGVATMVARRRFDLSFDESGPFFPQVPTSFEGLESLEQVAGLSLGGSGVTDLEPLRNLKTIGSEVDGVKKAGRLSIQNAEFLGSLAGLRALESLGSLFVSFAPLLEDLTLAGLSDGLTNLTLQSVPDVEGLGGRALKPEMGSVRLGMASAQPVDLSVLRTVQRVENLSLSGLPTFEDFSALRSVGQLSLSGEGTSDLGPLLQLESIEQVYFQSLAALVEPPVFAAAQSPNGSLDLHVSRCDLLVGIPEFPLVDSVGTLVVDSNPTLQTVQWPHLIRARDVQIRNNLRLRELSFAQLQSAEWALRVVSNPLLPSSQWEALAGVASPYLKIAGNEDQPVGVTPCPWTDDDICDEFSTGLCAENTDSRDCGF